MELAKLMILFLVGDDYDTNVRTLKGIFYQSCSADTRLIVCSNAVPGFDSEQMIYAFRVIEKTDDFAQVVLHESNVRLSEVDLIKLFSNKFESKYIAVIYTGDIFDDPSRLSYAMTQLDSSNKSKFNLNQNSILYKTNSLLDNLFKYNSKKSTIVSTIKKLLLRGD